MSILTVTFNPALDLETTTPEVMPGEKLRCTDPARDPGGGGINVARAIVQLGGEATALVAAGGAGGDALERMLAAHDVPVLRLPAPGEMRQNLSVIETTTGRQFRFIFPGPTWTPEDMTAATEALSTHCAPGDWVVLSGSLPPGVSPGALVDLVRRLTGQGAKVVADTSGAGLVALAGARTGMALLRVDFEESVALAGRALQTAADSAAFAADLVAQGAADVVIVARGAEGSVLASFEGWWMAPAARVPVVSRTGAGDSFVAGAVLALSRGLPLPEVLSHGCAAASAAVTTPATELCDAAMVQALLPQSLARPV
ncbi:1-phosphofructokinase family hexose kinase [Roseicyclus mahoneyensis]|uniref:Phosphofructokinase n=1 Tax=Roseicyclus mahoneyensis TaxID=164332 RepID=A0A316GNV8_9RHOB|nr:hexose kinase [Roseicyclus mahoneyensis]PWK62574.1 6-phosphofructokinase [Roseicyclus mahoneyensis]